MKDFFAIYDALLAGLDETARSARVTRAVSRARWAMAESGEHIGIAMADGTDTVAAQHPGGLEGLTLADAAAAMKSWNLREAGMGLAAANAYYNTPERIRALDCAEPYENYCTAGLRFDGATVGVIGHMGLTPEIHGAARKVYVIERCPRPGDYPDAACEYILPQCDYVFITGSALVNKTLPRLIELSRGAYTILTGPSVPLCPALLDLGIDRIAGMAVRDGAAMRAHVLSDAHGSPYGMGEPFLLKR